MRPPEALPLHLMLLMMQSGVSPAAWPGLSNPWEPWLPDWMRPKSPLERSADQWASAWQSLSQQLSDASLQWLKPNRNPQSANSSDNLSSFLSFLRPQEFPLPSDKEIPAFAGMTMSGVAEFWENLGQQASSQAQQFMDGLNAYVASDYQPAPMDYPVRWQRGSARLLDLAPAAKDAVAVLCIPSLINTARVLNLAPEHSFVQHLRSQGFRPLVLDWGSPGENELHFSTADYITAYALDALQHLRDHHDGPIALAGYCMGGVFSVAMAQLAPMFVDALILLATPWDFSAPDTPRVLLEPSAQHMLRQWIASFSPVPPMITQSIFHLIDPWRIQRKYSRFPFLSAEEKQHFLAIEQWVNDGVPLTQTVAQECFVDWPQGNILATHQWKVGRRWIEPASLRCPTLAVVPQHDAIVPAGCALPLAEAIPKCNVLMPDSGHVSMVCGKNAEQELWQPLVNWLKKKF